MGGIVGDRAALAGRWQCAIEVNETVGERNVSNIDRLPGLVNDGGVPGERRDGAPGQLGRVPTRSANGESWGLAITSSGLVRPGQSDTTATPCGRSSRAMSWVSRATAALPTLYGTLNMNRVSPADEMLTMTPWPCAILSGAAK